MVRLAPWCQHPIIFPKHGERHSKDKTLALGLRTTELNDWFLSLMLPNVLKLETVVFYNVPFAEHFQSLGTFPFIIFYLLHDPLLDRT